MQIVALSDTHNKHREMILPEPSGSGRRILVHCGDFTNSGTLEEVTDFIEWFVDIPNFDHKVLIAGNHDITLDTNYYNKKWRQFHTTKQDTQLISDIIRENDEFVYLEDYSVVLENLKFYGAPWVRAGTRDWAFCMYLPTTAEEAWKHIPMDTDVLLTHTPPYESLDRNSYDISVGCPQLKAACDAIRPKLHFFGHVHRPGMESTEYGKRFNTATACYSVNV